jgi:hypothetical protein
MVKFSQLRIFYEAPSVIPFALCDVCGALCVCAVRMRCVLCDVCMRCALCAVRCAYALCVYAVHVRCAYALYAVQ